LRKHLLPTIKIVISRNSYAYPIYIFISDTDQAQISSVHSSLILSGVPGIPELGVAVARALQHKGGLGGEEGAQEHHPLRGAQAHLTHRVWFGKQGEHRNTTHFAVLRLI
jgi:hypothetical protein